MQQRYKRTIQTAMANSFMWQNLQFLLHGRVKGRGVYREDVKGLGATEGYRGGLDCTFGE
jgi:hypothetical protein